MGERFKKWCLENKAVLGLVLASLTIHFLVSIFLFSKFNNNVLYFENEDAFSYVTVAENIVNGHGFSRDNMLSAVRTPGLPILYAGLMKLPGSFTWWVLIIQNMLLTATAVVIFYIGKNNFSSRAGLLAGYCIVLEPYMAMTANLATTETAFNFVLVTCIYYFIRWLKDPKFNKSLLISSLSAGLLILIRPVALYLPLVFLVVALVNLYFKKVNYKKSLGLLCVWALTVLAVVTPWSVRQYVRFGSARVTNIDVYMVYFKIAPLVVANQENISYNEATKILDSKLRQTFPGYDPLLMTNTFIYNQEMFRSARQIIFSKPSVLIRFYAVSIFPTLTGTGYEYMLEDIFGFKRLSNRPSYSNLIANHDWSTLYKSLTKLDIFQATLYGGVLLWFLIYSSILFAIATISWWQKYGLATAVLLAVIAYFVLFALGPASHARYRMPTIPLWFLLFAASLDFLLERCKIQRINSKK